MGMVKVKVRRRKKKKPIDSFRNEAWFLSNFCKSPIMHNGKFYPTAEHLFQALKTTDEGHHEYVRTARDAREAKYRGKLSPLREDWETAKDTVMGNVIRAKFVQNPNFKRLLLGTGKEDLIEGNRWHDNYWGNCLCAECGNIKGKNKLGEILMTVRRQLR